MSFNLSKFSSPPIDEVGIEERVARFSKQSLKNQSKVHDLRLAISIVDLTSLEATDTPEKIKQLCAKAKNLHPSLPELPSVAAVCVYPTLVRTAKKELEGTKIKVASVAGAFPSGMTSKEIKIIETKYAVDEGADEIDMVISRGHFLRGDYNYVFDEIASIKVACGKSHLKVILETGELNSLNNVRKASDLAMHAGADFIKTSTGKIQPAATLPATLVMLEAIRDFFNKHGHRVGIKPAGGISTAKIALQYLVMVRETLGEAWLTPDYFRFGASSLINDLLMQLMKSEKGMYQSPDYFSNE